MSDLGGEQPGYIPPEAAKPPVPPVAPRPEAALPVNPFAEKYKAQAEAKGVKSLEGGEWLAVDGIEYQQYGDRKEKIPASGEQNVAATRIDQVGTYDYNNGTFALVDQEGSLRIGHGTSANAQVLEKAGYRRGGMWVPFSNGEIPTDPSLRQQYLEIRERGREASKRENTERHLQVYSEIAERKGIKEVEGGLLMMVDGIEYRHFGNETGNIEVNTDGYNMPIRRVDQVGTFDSNNGRIAFVDGQGRMWVGASTEENFDAIRKAGYERGGIWVPFSNGEMPTDRETYERLRDVLTGKPADQLKAERAARVDEIIDGRQDLFGDVAHLPDRDELYAKVADRQETEYINSNELVERKLQARVETDNAGFERKVYTVNGVTFTFRGKEELPTYPTLSHSRAQLLGDAPQWVSPEDYQTYQSQVSETQRNENAPQHYLATKSLMGVVELATQLGSKDSSLVHLREELSKGVYSPRAITLLDALVASSYVGDGGFQLEPRANNNAEALVLAALLGDPQAQTSVAQKVEALRHLEQRDKVRTERRATESEELRPQDLVTVHATRYEPQVGADGELLVPTTFDATKGKVLRNSVHTALNHKVAGHMHGSWGDAGYVLISPFESMMEANGVPTVLNTVDTWWSRDPGEPLRFPDATIVKPGGSEVAGLYQIEGQTVKFKSEGLGEEELRALADYASEHGNLTYFARDLESSFLGNFSHYGPLQSDWDVDAATAAIGTHIFGQEGRWNYGDTALLRELTATIEGQPTPTLEQKIQGLIERSGAVNALKPEVQDREAAVTNLVNSVTNSIRGQMFSEINELAAREAIRSRGFDIQSGGMWAWGDSWTVTSQTAALGEQLGTDVAAHSNTAQHELTDRFSRTVSAAFEGKGDSSKFDWTKYDPQYDELVPRVDPKTRRVLYASGLLTSRG
ncbi:hypothetical protein LBMAG33_5910 [Candidatus Levyibacteriota bacterium]|nr:hypothetical protein LBMAG33_5910 [Candidatus Levybacteria bacterium]